MYQITIKCLEPTTEKEYDKWREVYEQRFEDLDVNGIVFYLNQLAIAGRKLKHAEPTAAPVIPSP